MGQMLSSLLLELEDDSGEEAVSIQKPGSNGVLTYCRLNLLNAANSRSLM